MGKYKQSMGKGDFLTELHRQCLIHLEPEIVEAMMLEVQAHLDESIQARLELGEAPKIAELNAIAAFEAPQGFARSMIQVHQKRGSHDRVLLALGSGVLAWISLSVHFQSISIDYDFIAYPLLAASAAIVARSFWLGAVQTVTLRKMALVGIILVGIVTPLVTLNLNAYGGTGLISVVSPIRPVGSEIGPSTDPSVGPFTEQEQRNRRAQEAALAAPLWERSTAMAPFTASLAIYGFQFAFLPHLITVWCVGLFRKLRSRRRRLPTRIA
jgi:hypothetical protein